MPNADLYTLSTTLRGKATGIRPAVGKVVKKGAQNVKNDWKKLFEADSRHGHARKYPRSISYDMDRRGVGIEAEIGPDKGRTQGPLGNLIEFGSVNNVGGNHGGRALEIEEPRFLAALRAVARLDL